jgi:uncharacterized protein (TIGR00369 family)
VEVLKRLRAEGGSVDLTRLPDLIPYARFMGFRVDVRGDEITAVMPFAERLVGNTSLPALHGGTIGALLEWTAVLQLLRDSDCARLPKTIDFSIDYLRSGRPVDTYARAHVTKLGRRVANVRMEAWQEERNRPIAGGHGHFLLMPAEP